MVLCTSCAGFIREDIVGRLVYVLICLAYGLPLDCSWRGQEGLHAPLLRWQTPTLPAPSRFMYVLGPPRFLGLGLTTYSLPYPSLLYVRSVFAPFVELHPSCSMLLPVPAQVKSPAASRRTPAPSATRSPSISTSSCAARHRSAGGTACTARTASQHAQHVGWIDDMAPRGVLETAVCQEPQHTESGKTCRSGRACRACTAWCIQHAHCGASCHYASRLWPSQPPKSLRRVIVCS